MLDLLYVNLLESVERRSLAKGGAYPRLVVAVDKVVYISYQQTFLFDHSIFQTSYEKKDNHAPNTLVGLAIDYV